ncbi:MAG: FAD-dependent monooxygenase [Caulobacteraceae bacterium]|nr:FAD-dependent monooxygenase [Caulobacter sp.]
MVAKTQGADAPVLVVGAGPVGLTMAAELARYGVPVRIIDHSPKATETSKALVVWSRTLELLDRAGCADDFVAAGLKGHGALFRIGHRDLAHADFADIPSPYNFACMIPQSETERLMTAQLAKRGGRIEREVELTNFEPTAEGVRCRLTHGAGREEEIETPWLLGCDGAHSTVRKGLGLAFEGYAMDDEWALADVRLAGDGAPPPDRIAIHLHADGPFITFPMPGGRARVIATTGKADGGQGRPEPTLAEVQSLIDARAGGGFQAVDPVWLSRFRINERKLKDYRHGRVFLAGDAAHVHSPAGGQGMNTGMQDAINLAWKLALVMHGGAEPALLDSYSPERSAVGEMVLRNAARLTEMATLANPVAQTLRNAALHVFLGLHAVQDKMAAAMSETDIGYAHSPLSQGRQAGRRLLPADYAGAAPGSGAAPRFVLFAADAERGRQLSAHYPTLIEAAPREPPDARSLLVVRPDGYVGFDGAAGDWSSAERYLGALLPG